MMKQRRRFKQSQSLQDRVAAFAQVARDEAEKLRAGIERNDLLSKAGQADTAARLDYWANSLGPEPPK